MNVSHIHRPSWIELAELWLTTHFAGKQAIVFFHPAKEVACLKNIVERFNIMPSYLFGEFYVHVTDTDQAIDIVNGQSQAEVGFIMLWDGKQFVTENW